MDKQYEWEAALESLAEELEDCLPNDDREHKDELLDIIELLKKRLSMYVSDYGLRSQE